LAEALTALLDQPGRRAELGAAARRRVDAGFTWQMVARRTSALYEALWHERATSARTSESAAIRAARPSIAVPFGLDAEEVSTGM
jgi:hypothetical protein